MCGFGGVGSLYFHLDLLGKYNLIRFSLMHSLPLEPLAIVMCLKTPLWTQALVFHLCFQGKAGGRGDSETLLFFQAGIWGLRQVDPKNLLEMPSPEIRGFSPLAFCRQWRHLVGFDAGH